MKRLLFTVLMLWGVVYGQVCTDEDTVRSNTATMITYNSARINGTTAHMTGAVTSIQLKYVRVGLTDTVTSSGLSALRNITGLQASTQYYYYYKTICGSGTQSQTIGAYTFTTAANTIIYASERPTVFHYVYADSLLQIGAVDTSLYRAPTHPSIVYKSSDDTYYGYHLDCSCWQPLAIDSSGIIALLDDKVDSVTVSGDSLFYWKVGVSYGYILPSVATVWHTTGNAGIDTSTDFIGTTDNVDFPIKTNDVRRFTVNTSGSLGIGATPDYGTSGYVLKSAGNAAAPTWSAYTLQNALTAGSTLTGANTVLAGNNTLVFDWGTLTDDGFEIASSSTTAAGDAQRLMLINLGGINANSGQETTALEVDNGHTGTTSTNIALKTGANGGASANIGLWVDRGISRFGTTLGESGQLDILGLTSGTISIKPQDAAGTWTMTLPTTDGNSGEFLQTDGSGVTSWAAPSGGSLTATYIGYGSAGNALTGDANLTYTAASSAVVIDSGYLSFTGHKAYGSTVAGSIFKHSDYGLTTRAIAGTTYDWLMFSTGGNTVLANPTGTDNFLTSGRWGFGSLGLTPTAKVHIAAGSTSASTAPLKFVSGSLMTTAEAGAVEFLTDKAYLTITTGAARKELTLNDAALTSGRVPYVTTNGRLTDNSNFTFDGTVFSVVANSGLDALSTSNAAFGDFNNATGIQISGSNASDIITYKSATTHTFSTGTVTMSAYAAGTATFDASGNITSVSDMRLKDLQGMYEVGINRILQINPIVYKWNEKSKLERNHNYIGFSAQNVKDALGENAIGVNKEGYYSLQDRALLAAVVNGEKDLYKIIQEQQKQIDGLKKDIKRLKK